MFADVNTTFKMLMADIKAYMIKQNKSKSKTVSENKCKLLKRIKLFFIFVGE